MYFKQMPTIVYPVDGKQVFVKDILKRVATRSRIINKTTLINYRIGDGETPDIIAHDYYGNSRYHWIILLVNDIIDPYDEWPLPEEEISNLVVNKYGANSAGLTHHYRITGSDPEIIVDYDAAKLTTGEYEVVTNYTAELEHNEEKRRIFLLKPEYLKDFVNTYKTLMGA